MTIIESWCSARVIKISLKEIETLTLNQLDRVSESNHGSAKAKNTQRQSPFRFTQSMRSVQLKRKLDVEEARME